MSSNDSQGPLPPTLSIRKEEHITSSSQLQVSDSPSLSISLSPSQGSFTLSREYENNVEILSSPDSEYLAERLAVDLGVKRRKIVRREFGDGEKYYRIAVNERTDLLGADVIYVASTHTDIALMELLRVGMQLASMGTRKRIFIIPYLGYSTMERAVLPGEIISAKHNARLLSAIPNTGMGNIFMYMDLHVQGVLHYQEGPSMHYELYAEKILTELIKEYINFDENECIFASADMGRPLWVESFARIFGTEVAYIRKKRSMDQTYVENVIGEVSGKTVIIYDDMTRSGGTLINAAQAYLNKGATRVYAVLSHLALCNISVAERLRDATALEKIITTNSHPASQWPVVVESEKFVVANCAPLFSHAVYNYIMRRKNVEGNSR